MIVVAYFNHFDGVIVQKTYACVTPLQAMNAFLGTRFDAEDELYEYCNNSDSVISYLEI
jgi:hypothetical protein